MGISTAETALKDIMNLLQSRTRFCDCFPASALSVLPACNPLPRCLSVIGEHPSAARDAPRVASLYATALRCIQYTYDSGEVLPGYAASQGTTRAMERGTWRKTPCSKGKFHLTARTHGEATCRERTDASALDTVQDFYTRCGHVTHMPVQ